MDTSEDRTVASPRPITEPSLRLEVARKRINRAVLDGAWWPRSWDAPSELSDLVQALSARYGAIRTVILNGAAWAERARQLTVDGRRVRVGWFASMSPALLSATTDVGDQVDLLIVPPSFDEDAAVRAMARAADPTNFEHAPQLLAADLKPLAPDESPTVRGMPEAVWDNEGGARAG